MTIPRLLAINKYHKRNPPIHIMVAAYLEAGTKDDAPVSLPVSSGLNDKGESLFDLFPGRVGKA